MSTNDNFRYCPSCQRYVLPGREDYATIYPPTPPPWRVTDVMIVPVCAECGDVLGPTIAEMMAEMYGDTSTANN